MLPHVAAPHCCVCRSWHPRSSNNAVYSSPNTRDEGCYKVWQDSQRLDDMGATAFWEHAASGYKGPARLWKPVPSTDIGPFAFVTLTQAAIPLRSNPRDASTCGSSEGPFRPDERSPPNAGAAPTVLPSAVPYDSPTTSQDPADGSLHESGGKRDCNEQHHDEDARSSSPLRHSARLRPSRIGPYWGRRLRSSGTTVGN